MKQFVIMPERGRFFTVPAQSAEAAYLAVCSDFLPSRPVGVIDTETGAGAVYIRELDETGNLAAVRPWRG